MSQITERIDNICASLYLAPATAKELNDKEFLKNIALENVERLLFMAEKDDKIYMKKNNKYYCYKHTALNLNKKGYELQIK